MPCKRVSDSGISRVHLHEMLEVLFCLCNQFIYIIKILSFEADFINVLCLKELMSTENRQKAWMLQKGSRNLVWLLSSLGFLREDKVFLHLERKQHM